MSGRRAERGGFVGRDAPLERIGDALRAALGGQTRLVLVSGEAGMGKTALLQEAVRAVPDGTRVAWGTCLDAERAPGYWPWTQVLRDLIERGGAPIDQLAEPDRRLLARLVPELDPDVDGSAIEEDPDRARFRFFDAVARWLERAATVQPLIVVLDDLQWADPSSLQLLELVVRPHRPVPLLLLGAYRHDELSGEQAELLRALRLRAENVRLQGLSADEVAALLAGTVGDEQAERWSSTVHRRTDGHPFLVRELAYALATEHAPDTVPDAARDLIAARLARLTPACRTMLEAAAIAGDELFPDVLAEVLDRSATTIASQIQEAARAGVLLDGGEATRTRFAHDLYRRTIAEQPAADARLELHRAIGTALEQRLARGGRVFATDLARHFAAAAPLDGPERAIRWARTAAEADRARLAFAEAAGQLARVRATLDDAGVVIPAPLLVDLLVAHADAEERAGRPEIARQLLRDARAHAASLRDPERIAAVALGFQRLGARFAMPRDEIVALLDEARTAVEGGSPVLEARITASLARELRHSVPKDRARAEPLSERAVAIARTLDDPGTLAACLLARHDVLWTPGSAAQRVTVARDIVALAERDGDDELRSEGQLLVANALLEQGSPAFRAELEPFFQLEAQLGQPRHEYLAMTRRAALALLDGSLDDAERLVQAAATLGERIGEPDAGNVRMSQLLEVARARGEPNRLRATAEMAIGWWTGVPSHAHAVAAGLFAEAGATDAARRALDTVRDLGSWREDRSYLWSVFVGGLASAAARLEDRDLAEELLEELVPLVDACGVNGAVVCFAGSLAHQAGIAARTLGRTAQARELLEHALAVHHRLGARAWEAATCVELAEISDDADARASHHARAAELAEQLGLHGIATRLATTSAARAQPGAASFRREGDTWALQYQGRTVRLRDAKGLHDLAHLLAHPGDDVSVLDLAASGVRETTAAAPVLDPTARAAFRRRLAELEGDLEDARAQHDLGQVARIETERDALLEELRLATGAHGKDRGLGGRVVERARKAVTARVRDTIGRIAAAHPELGAHLDRSIVTGTHCRYEPVEPLTWDLS